jgi:hypothetical protein
MSKNIDDVIKEVMKSNKEIHRVDNKLSKDIDTTHREIQSLKKEVKLVSAKIDSVLEILNTLTIFIEDAEQIIDDEDIDEEYSSNEGWIPEVNNWEDKNTDDEDEEDEIQ